MHAKRPTRWPDDDQEIILVAIKDCTLQHPERLEFSVDDRLFWGGYRHGDLFWARSMRNGKIGYVDRDSVVFEKQAADTSNDSAHLTPTVNEAGQKFAAGGDQSNAESVTPKFSGNFDTEDFNASMSKSPTLKKSDAPPIPPRDGKHYGNSYRRDASLSQSPTLKKKDVSSIHQRYGKPAPFRSSMSDGRSQQSGDGNSRLQSAPKYEQSPGKRLPPPPPPPSKTARHVAEDLEGCETPLPFFEGSKRDQFDVDYWSEGWFFGKLSQAECDQILYHKKNFDGAFLVRESSTVPGSPYCLSVLYETSSMRQAHHYRIKKHENGYLYRNLEVLFRTLNEMVFYYSAIQGDLVCKLTKSCDIWETDHKSVELGEEIARGHFGKVHKGKYNQMTVAVKTIGKNDIEMEAFLKEAGMMKVLMHPNIVKLCGKVSTAPVYIITEFMINGSLHDYLDKGDGKRSHFRDHISMALQVAKGMEYIESKNFIHRDLRSANVLVGDDGACKIADFGLARVIKEGIYRAKSNFPLRWTAPEALSGSLEFSIKSDVWSFGILVIEILTYGKMPYSELKDNEDVEKRVLNGYRIPMPKACQRTLYNNIVWKCWCEDPPMRPSFSTLAKLLESYGAS